MIRGFLAYGWGVTNEEYAQSSASQRDSPITAQGATLGRKGGALPSSYRLRYQGSADACCARVGAALACVRDVALRLDCGARDGFGLVRNSVERLRKNCFRTERHRGVVSKQIPNETWNPVAFTRRELGDEPLRCTKIQKDNTLREPTMPYCRNRNLSRLPCITLTFRQGRSRV